MEQLTTILNDVIYPTNFLPDEETVRAINEMTGIDGYLNRWWLYMLTEYSFHVTTVVLPIVILFGLYFGISAVQIWCESNRFAWLQKYKIQKSKYNDDAAVWKCVKYNLFNYFLVILPLYSTAFPFFVKFLFPVSLPLPSWPVMLAQILFCVLAEDFSHYWAHRALHLPFLYKAIHSVHHEYSAPISIATTYAHPIEVMLLGVAAFSGPLLLRCHFLVMVTWIILRQVLAMETHCGYDFPLSPNRWHWIFGGAELHDFHHRTYNGAYASNLVLWDWVFGTDKGYFLYRERAAKKQQQQQQQQRELQKLPNQS